MSVVELRRQRFDELKKIILDISPISSKGIFDFFEEKRKTFPFLNICFNINYLLKKYRDELKDIRSTIVAKPKQ